MDTVEIRMVKESGESYSQMMLLLGEFDEQKSLLLRNQEQLSCTLRGKLTAVQRSATTEQLRVQTERVAILDANMSSTLTMFFASQAKVRAAVADSPEAKDFYESIQYEHEIMHELFTERAAVQLPVTSKQLPIPTEEEPDLELPEYEDIPDMSPAEMIEEYLRDRTEEEEEEDIEEGMTDEDMIEAYLLSESWKIREPEDFQISAADKSAAARAESKRRTRFFKRQENKGKQGQIDAELNYLLDIEVWDQEMYFRHWLGEVGCCKFRTTDDEWRNLTGDDVKLALWSLLTPGRKKVVTFLKPGSKLFVHDPLDEYLRRLVATFQPALYTDRRKREYEARVHNQGESVEKYITDKMKLFKASHRTSDFKQFLPSDFKQFLQTGLQSIYPSTLRQHITAQPYRNEEGLMRNIAAISAKLKTLPDSKSNPTGTLAGITPPMQRGESRIPSTQTRAVSHPHSRTSECITEA